MVYAMSWVLQLGLKFYGVKHIGSIKALTTALMVFATASGTAIFGVLIDKGLFNRTDIFIFFRLYFYIYSFLIFNTRKIEPNKNIETA